LYNEFITLDEKSSLEFACVISLEFLFFDSLFTIILYLAMQKGILAPYQIQTNGNNFSETSGISCSICARTEL